MQAAEGFDALIGANRGCYAAFAAVYECAVPVIAAVNGHCLGGGIGLVGNADVIVAADDATFGLPEVDAGALGGTPRPARASASDAGDGVPARRPRPGAAPLQQRPRGGPRRRAAQRGDARGQAIAAKSPTVIRAAKESLNGIDLWDVKRSHRFEQGFTFELNLSGVADEHRDAFVEKRDTDTST